MIKFNRPIALIFLLVSVFHFSCKNDEKSEPASVAEPTPSGVVSGDNPISDSGASGGTTELPEPPTEDTPPPLVPGIELTNRPVDPTFNTSTSISFAAKNFTASSFSCSIDGAAFTACTSPLEISGFSSGHHVISIKSLASGSEVKATYAWTVDQNIEKMPINTHLPSSSSIQDYVEADGSIYVATNQGIIYSRNDGKTATVKDVSSGMPTRFTYKIEVVGQKLFVATQQGLVVSGDLGTTLSNKTTSDGLYSNFVGWIFYDREIDRLYALHVTGMSYSDNGGVSFSTKTAFTGIGTNAFTQMFVTDAGRVFLLATNNTVYTAASLDGTYTSVKASVSRMFVTASGKLYVATSTGLHYSNDNGQTFLNKQTAAGLPSNTVYSIAASNDGKTVLVGTDTGYAYSFNSGESFEDGSISLLSTGLAPNNIGRVFLAETGRAMISDQTALTLTKFQMRDISRSYTDHTAPVAAKTSYALASALGSGVSMLWTQATDDSSAKSDLVYEIFGGPVGADFSDLQSVYLNGDLIGRYEGVGFAPVYLSPDTDKRLALIVKDEAGNKAVYGAIDTSSSSAAAQQTWSQATADGGIGKLIDHRVTKQGNKLYIVGGVILDPMPITVQNKVYSTLDGVNWSEVAQTGSDAERADHGLTSFNDKIWISGGYDRDGFPKGDVLYSTTGASWTSANSTAAFGPRRGHAMLAFKNKMWVIGGNTKPTGGSWAMKSDVWSSTDGVNWIKATEDAGFSAAAKANVVATTHYLYFLGEGTDTSVWRSADGASWEKILDQRPTGTNFSFAVAIHGGEIYTIGGSKTNAGVWKSPDGVIWESVSTGSTIPEREDHISISYLDKIWMYQGVNAGYKADIWSGQ
jgi:hypothetical protein